MRQKWLHIILQRSIFTKSVHFSLTSKTNLLQPIIATNYYLSTKNQGWRRWLNCTTGQLRWEGQ
jgi:hypothetical protein